MIDKGASYTVADTVHWNQTNLEVTLMDEESEAMFGLTGAGGEMWKGLASGLTVGEIVRQMQSEFEVKPEQLETDLSQLVEQLTDKGLIRRATGIPA